ncbi:MAG: TraR/DksA C4-type zinc finger protein [Chloroflexi bacterium]|nr:TraR/DksA C4-type zinc finger protein [Chloroflexota bacterium]
MQTLDEILKVSASRHTHLCPRQVLGARIGLAGASALGMELPRRDKRLLVILETDGCFADGIEAATACTVGHRTLRIEDYGKTAATFVDTLTEQTIRISPRNNARELAWEYAPSARNKWESQLIGYQHIPDELLFHCQWVELTVSVKQIIGQPGKRVMCEACGEEIINQREVMHEGTTLCRACAGYSYYLQASSEISIKSQTN